MPRPRPLPPGLADHPFSVSQADALGVPRGRLRARDLTAPFHGIRMPRSASDDLVTRCSAYAAAATDDHVFSHATAALLWGIPLPRRLEDDPRVHVLYVRAARAPRGRGVVGHKTDRPVATVVRAGLRVTDTVATWLALVRRSRRSVRGHAPRVRHAAGSRSCERVYPNPTSTPRSRSVGW